MATECVGSSGSHLQVWRLYISFPSCSPTPLRSRGILRLGTGAGPNLPAAPSWEGLVDVVDLDLQEPGESQWECAKSRFWGGILPAAMPLHIEMCFRTWLSKAALCWTNLTEIWLQPCVLHQCFKPVFFFLTGALAEMLWHSKFGRVHANIPDGSSWLSCLQI